MSGKTIPEAFKPLFTGKTFAQMATLNADGSPQVTPVWVDLDGDEILVNTAKGRVKDRNVRRNPVVTLSLQDPENAYRYISVQGRVTTIVEQGAVAHIDKLAQRYMEVEKYPYIKPGDVRQILTIVPERIHTMG
jgi:PPOX class probable F420-dependent enzyme